MGENHTFHLRKKKKKKKERIRWIDDIYGCTTVYFCKYCMCYVNEEKIQCAIVKLDNDLIMQM